MPASQIILTGPFEMSDIFQPFWLIRNSYPQNLGNKICNVSQQTTLKNIKLNWFRNWKL